MLGSWRGAGRYVLAVDRTSGRVSVLDPRTGRTARARVPVAARTRSWTRPSCSAATSTCRTTPSRSCGGSTPASGAVRDGALPVPGRAGDAFDLTVSGGHVWANSQYDRRALIVDGDGRDHTADKGAGPDVATPRPSRSRRRRGRRAPAHRRAAGPPRPPHVRRPGDARPAAGRAPEGAVGDRAVPPARPARSSAAPGSRAPRTPTPTPAIDPDQFGVVSAQSPEGRGHSRPTGRSPSPTRTTSRCRPSSGRRRVRRARGSGRSR